MIIRCENGRLLNADHVVEWDIRTEGDEQTHTVNAKTVFDTSVDVFEGTESDCQARLDTIYVSLSEESTLLRHLCESLTKRDDKLSATIRRFIINRY